MEVMPRFTHNMIPCQSIIKLFTASCSPHDPFTSAWSERVHMWQCCSPGTMYYINLFSSPPSPCRWSLGRGGRWGKSLSYCCMSVLPKEFSMAKYPGPLHLQRDPRQTQGKKSNQLTLYIHMAELLTISVMRVYNPVLNYQLPKDK